METIVYRRMESPLGPIRVAASGTGIKCIAFERTHSERAGAARPQGAGAGQTQHWEALGPGNEGAPAGLVLLRAGRQIEEYFAGIRRDFDLPLDADGNPFQQRVWRELCRIPYGETRSYGQLAERIGRPGAARAVGSANARNPLAIVVPCHRVIGADGRLTGYAGGLQRKAFLLELERRSSAGSAAPSRKDSAAARIPRTSARNELQTELFAARASAPHAPAPSPLSGEGELAALFAPRASAPRLGSAERPSHRSAGSSRKRSERGGEGPRREARG